MQKSFELDTNASQACIDLYSQTSTFPNQSIHKASQRNKSLLGERKSQQRKNRDCKWRN